ncbi:MAG: GGDEF domain-containing protein [Pseudoxanthomonas sp.]
MNPVDSMLHRFRKNSQLRLLTWFGLSVALFVSVFGVYRLLDGMPFAAISDFMTAAVIAGAVVYALMTGNTRKAGLALCIINSLCCILACLSVGSVAVYWSYLVLITNFFFAPAKMGFVVNLLLVASMLIILGPNQPAIVSVSIGVSATMVTLFNYFFTRRIDADRGMLEKIASQDALTGLPNRRTMEQFLTETLRLHHSKGLSYGLIILDIDHFKQVNDSFGHPAGDAVLADIAAILKREMRSKDQAFRFGGEEFVVVGEVANAADLHVACERIRVAIGDDLQSPGGPLTISAGAALLGQEDKWQEWFSLADAALYRAKRQGRDRTIVAE